MNTFQQLGLEDHLLQAIKDLGFETPSEVQQKAIPTLLSEENDLVAWRKLGREKQRHLVSHATKDRCKQKNNTRVDFITY